MDGHVAIDRSLDQADLDPHARFHLERGDLLDEEALARLGIEEQQQARDQHHQPDDQAGQADGDLLPQRAALADHHGLGRFGRGERGIFRHQKACPIPM